ncbi:MAG TPA: methyltransferase domain-containing protein [Oscillospiraceae bacterium]|nr:methyltransferase domain-containing protein [Oscillospiraceae bacterium]
MKYEKAEKYEFSFIKDFIMGPNPIKLEEELLLNHDIPQGATVLDLGCGRGLTSVFLVKEYGFRVFATDLWIGATENKRFFDRMGLSTEQIIPIHADAVDLPYAEEFFDAVVCTDSYNFFGRDPEYLGTHLLPFVKHGGCVYISIPGMKKDCHDHLPPELLLSWTPEQLDYIHDADYWKNIIRQTEGAEILSIHEMESNEECWNDWLATDNEYAVSDRKSMEAGAGAYMNFIAIVLRRK